MSAKERYSLGGKHSPRKEIYLAVFDRQGMSFTCRFIAAMENYILGGHNIFLAQWKFCRQPHLLGGQAAKEMILGGQPPSKLCFPGPLSLAAGRQGSFPWWFLYFPWRFSTAKVIPFWCSDRTPSQLQKWVLSFQDNMTCCGSRVIAFLNWTNDSRSVSLPLKEPRTTCALQIVRRKRSCPTVIVSMASNLAQIQSLIICVDKYKWIIN